MKKQPCLSSIYCFSAWIYFWLISILRIFFHSHAILLRIRFNLLHDLLLVCFFLFCFFVISDIGHLWKCAALGQHPSAFLYECGIQSMQQLHEKISDMNSRYYDLRGKIVKAERGEMRAQYNKYKPIHKQLAKLKPAKRELFEQRHSRELILYDAAARYLKELKDSGEEITPKAW